MMQVRINPTSIETMRFLQNNIDQFPNRVQAAKGKAVVSAKLKIEQYMKSQYGKVGNAMVVEEKVGPKTVTVNIRPKRAGRPNSRTGYSAAWGANVKFYGRRSFSSSGSVQIYKLRKGSTPPYPPYIRSFRVKATPKDMSFRSNIRRESRRILEREMMKSLRSYGFGARGGAPRGMADI
tara:strand:+ start:6447 stop:6983 length:537 start_codon:yes stop_codon:yes gene_type:complete